MAASGGLSARGGYLAGEAFGDIPKHQIWRVPRRHEMALARPAPLVSQPRSGFAQRVRTLEGAFAELADRAPGESPTLLVTGRSLVGSR